VHIAVFGGVPARAHGFHLGSATTRGLVDSASTKREPLGSVDVLSHAVTRRLGMGTTAAQASRGSIPSKLNEEKV
jgi:hypothetical protein